MKRWEVSSTNVTKKSLECESCIKARMNSLMSIFQKKIPQHEVDGNIGGLFAHELVSEAKGTITYEF